LTKNKINNFIKDNLNLLVNETLSNIVLLKIKLEEEKQRKKKQAVEKFFSESFSLDNDNKISIQHNTSELEQEINNIKETLTQTSNIASSAILSIKKLETDAYATMSKIVDKIDRLGNKKEPTAIVLTCGSETDTIQIKENLYVKKCLDYNKLSEQQAVFQLFLDGILQVNDTADKGDYLLMVNENNNIAVLFHEAIPAGTSISIFAIKSS